MVLAAARHSILRRAEDNGIVEFGATNPRDFTHDNHRTVDDSPYGGGPGMVMMCEPVSAAINSTRKGEANCAVVVVDPTGEPFTQASAAELATLDQIILVCGHYEGIDGRITELYATHVFSVGDFVVTGGELPALLIADSVVRLLPGALGSEESLTVDSHGDSLLSAPQYTRPESFEGLAVPKVLRSGDHGAVAAWRRARALTHTRATRPDLFWAAQLRKQDCKLLSEEPD